MKYISTRNCSNTAAPHETIIQGLASDGGLYVPEKLSRTISPEEVLSLSYQQTAVRIMHAFLDDFSEEQLKNCVTAAYDDKFDTGEIVPLRPFSCGSLMELWHGPTSAFKDLALTVLPHLMSTAYRMEKRDDTIAILTATSGDTGKAAISGFADVPHTAITVFYPEIGVSPIQKRQMITSPGKNVEVIAVQGNFDDCQRMVKQAVSDPQVLSHLHHVVISSANSINVGRLVPQVVYYYASYAKLVKNGTIACGDPVDFVVPTGNFGDILAGWLASRIGLPVHRLICASNSNNVLTDFIHTGTYSLHRDFHTTMSPSMDILISSNLERLLFMMSDHDDALIRKLMSDLNTQGSYTIPESLHRKIQQTFSGYWTSEEDTSKVIHDLWHKEHILIDPHTAVAVGALRQYQKETGSTIPAIVLSTASPCKFAHDVLRSIGEEDPSDDFAAMDALHEKTGVPVPDNLSALKNMPVRFTRSIRVKDGMKVIGERMEEISHAQD